jgi:tetratricopeptide (TPR) repeat protein
MRIKLAKKFTRSFLFLLALGFLGACGPRAETLYSEAYSEIEAGRFRIAVDLLEKSANLETKNIDKYRNLSEAARLTRFEILDYPRAIRMYREVILKAEDQSQRIAAQEAVSEIYLENIQDYQLALRELQILEPLLTDNRKKERTRLRIAQALYLTGNYQQALEEINSAQKLIKFHELNFLKLKAQVLVGQKKYKEAIEAYDDLRNKNVNFFKEENLFIATSVVYEENEEYAEAMNFLTKYETMVKDKAYLELRIKRLKERMANKPLFKGKRK